jgi:hypothetical protein
VRYSINFVKIANQSTKVHGCFASHNHRATTGEEKFEFRAKTKDYGMLLIQPIGIEQKVESTNQDGYSTLDYGIFEFCT